MPIALPKMPIFELEIQSIGSICIKMVAPPLEIVKGKLSKKHRYAKYQLTKMQFHKLFFSIKKSSSLELKLGLNQIESGLEIRVLLVKNLFKNFKKN